MLLAVDVGNTNTVLGVFRAAGSASPEELLAHWRIETRKGRTADEYSAALHGLFALAGLPWVEGGRKSIDAVIVSCVVPPALFPLESMCREHLGVAPLVVGPGIKTGMPILAENPREVGADRIVNAVAAYELLNGERARRARRASGGAADEGDDAPLGCIVVDFGTATTFDVITPRGEYLGGAIAPGITISADALYERAAKLPRVEIARPKSVVGKNTVTSMQSGLYFGYVGLVDGIVERMLAEVPFPARVLATGGLAPLVARDSRTIQASDEMLTLNGLQILFHRNQGGRPTPSETT